MAIPEPITPCLWFDQQAEEAAKFYTSIFDDSKSQKATRAMLGMKKLDIAELKRAYER